MKRFCSFFAIDDFEGFEISNIGEIIEVENLNNSKSFRINYEYISSKKRLDIFIDDQLNAIVNEEIVETTEIFVGVYDTTIKNFELYDALLKQLMIFLSKNIKKGVLYHKFYYNFNDTTSTFDKVVCYFAGPNIWIRDRMFPKGKWELYGYEMMEGELGILILSKNSRKFIESILKIYRYYMKSRSYPRDDSWAIRALEKLKGVSEWK